MDAITDMAGIGGAHVVTSRWRLQPTAADVIMSRRDSNRAFTNKESRQHTKGNRPWAGRVARDGTLKRRSESKQRAQRGPGRNRIVGCQNGLWIS